MMQLRGPAAAAAATAQGWPTTRPLPAAASRRRLRHHTPFVAAAAAAAAPTAAATAAAAAAAATQRAATPPATTASRRSALLSALAAAALAALQPARPASAATAADLVAPRLAGAVPPDQSLYDAADPALRDAAALLQRALNAESVAEEEALFTELIDKYAGVRPAPVWAADVVGRAYGNRGNARARQGRMQEALGDYNRAVELCPWSLDPLINRGAALEGLGRFEDAIADYDAAIAAQPGDPVPHNNRGNALMGLQRFPEARDEFAEAVRLGGASYAFAAANLALATWAAGEREPAIKQLRNLLRRYPDFDDCRAALAAALWSAGREGDAETNFFRVGDPRYKSVAWLRERRRWPPQLVDAVQALLELRSI